MDHTDVEVTQKTSLALFHHWRRSVLDLSATSRHYDSEKKLDIIIKIARMAHHNGSVAHIESLLTDSAQVRNNPLQ